MSDFSKLRKCNPIADEMVIRGEKFTKVDENRELDVYCYRREWKDRNGNSNHCFEIIRPVGKDRHYPCAEQFGTYGLCISKNDRYLQEKIQWYMKNGIGERFPPSNPVNN